LFNIASKHVFVAIYDSFIDYNRKELFLCKLKDNSRAWFHKANIPKALLNKYVDQKFRDDNYRRKENSKKEAKSNYEKICQVDKTDEHTCDLKAHTRGLLIGFTNCGTIISFKEMYAKESLTQVTRFILATKRNFKGKVPLAINVP
jgi:hypothetical protein